MSPIIQTTRTLRARDGMDHYPTPRPLCDAALALLAHGKPPELVCDPGAGTGVWGAAARALWPAACLVGVEMRPIAPLIPPYDVWHTEDYLSEPRGLRYDLICGNPPYRLAEAFVRQGLSQLEYGGTLLFLLPLGFLASQKRSRGLFDTDPPAAVYICASRPSFTGNNKTDATDYAIVVWRKNLIQGRTVLDWLDWKAAPDPAGTPTQDALFAVGLP